MKRFLFILVLCLNLLRPEPGFCQEIYKVHTHLALVSENKEVKPGKPFWVALRVSTDPNWHTYWQNPGDSGLPTKIQWRLPDGFSASEIAWPFPERLQQGRVVSYGYTRPVLLLTQITPPKGLSQREISLEASVSWLACEVPCIPGDAQLGITLPVALDGQIHYSQWKDEFDQFRQELPKSSDEWNISAYQDQDNVTLRIVNKAGQKVSSAYFFSSVPMQILNAASQELRAMSDIEGMNLVMKKDLRGGPREIEALRGALVLNITGQQKPLAIDIHVFVGAAVASEKKQDPAVPAGITVLIMFVFAFLGGVLLNVMPCVFPVLSIKVLHFVNQSRSKRQLWQNAIVYAAGIITTFLSVSLLLIVLRAGGAQLGWGFQFQSPSFVVSMSLVLFIIALNLFGIFEFIFPARFSFGPGSSEGWQSSFLSGILAVIVSTPCTAPFMGTALSFALTQPVYLSAAIFFFLGLGMALPFVLFLAWPGLIDHLPRPGQWMEFFKKSLGFVMLGPVVWLLWVLSAQQSEGALIAVLTGMLVLSCGLWVWGVVSKSGESARTLKAFAVALIMIGLVMPFTGVNTLKDDGANFHDKSSVWHEYEEQQLSQWEQAGEVVFLDFSARWCLTCQANEKLVLTQPSVTRYFDRLGIIRVKADWTNKDPRITEILGRFGRASVPTYVLLYGPPDDRQYKVLPELLTPGLVKGALDKINLIQKEEKS